MNVFDKLAKYIRFEFFNDQRMVLVQLWLINIRGKNCKNITQESSQWSQNIVIETGHCQDQLNTRHNINVIVNNKKREYQQRYRERNRDKLKQHEMERRKRIRDSLSIAGPSISSNMID
ncbi:hypothetical protein PV328_011730 [Microctonus aethiopoides]|uniref:Uncharacterized protein n=1 Tax=Microctonus aethiopoides TaxID=144406 RepID=A0AA39C3G4_9HYME|nr:hypothetical protein PV328_011730 [Microctonus aethiopoides]